MTIMIYIILFSLIHFVYFEKPLLKQTGGISNININVNESMLIGRQISKQFHNKYIMSIELKKFNMKYSPNKCDCYDSKRDTEKVFN